MQEKIMNGLTTGKYTKTVGGYCDRAGGWMDYLLLDRILFSHRVNDDTTGEVLDKLHAHDYYELTLITSGEGIEYIADKQCIQAGGGMAILTKPNQFHMFRRSKPTFYDRFVLCFRNPLEIMPDPAFADFTQAGDTAFAAFKVPEDLLRLELTAMETALSDGNAPYAHSRTYLRVCELFLTLSTCQATCAGSVHPPLFISQIKEYVDENYLHIRTVQDLADTFFYSREHISRSFRQYYNTPLYDYILQRKLFCCCRMLQDGALVEEAAHCAGFYNMASFVNIFRKNKGCTPSEYKAKNSRVSESHAK